MRVEWHGQSRLHPERGRARRSSSTRSATWRRSQRARAAVRLPADRGLDAPTCCWSPTSTSTTTRSRRSAASRRSCARPPGRWSRRSARCVGDRLRARRRGRHRARPEHDLRLRRSTALRIAHFGDFGQRELRDEQAAAIGAGRPALRAGRRRPDDRRRAGARERRARAAARAGSCRCTTARTRIDFLEPADEFLERFDDVERLEAPSFELANVGEGAVVPAAP